MKIFMGENISCALNYQFDVILSELAKKYEIVEEINEADVIIFAGTCCCQGAHLKVTMEYIHEIVAQKKAGAKVFMTGCLTREFYDDELNKMVQQFIDSHIDVVVPQNDTNLLLQYISKEEFGHLDPNAFGAALSNEYGQYSLFISNGCANRCTFCKTTFQKYPLRSVPFELVKQAIDALHVQGEEELLIKGTNICQYGLDTEGVHLLPELIRYIETKKHIKHVALVGYAFKDAIQHGFLELFPESDKHYILSGSIESGSNRILELMNKGFTREQILDFITRIRTKANIEIMTEIIAGFPTETIDDVKQTLEVLKRVRPSYVGIHKYGDFPHVASHVLEQLSDEEKLAHARIYGKALRKEKIYYQLG